MCWYLIINHLFCSFVAIHMVTKQCKVGCHGDETTNQDMQKSGIQTPIANIQVKSALQRMILPGWLPCNVSMVISSNYRKTRHVYNKCLVIVNDESFIDEIIGYCKCAAVVKSQFTLWFGRDTATTLILHAEL